MLLCVLRLNMAAEPMTQSWDHRDQAVPDALDEAELDRVSLTDLRHAYRSKTDVRDNHTLKERIKHLTREGPFERVKFQVWRYDGQPST